MNVGDKMTQYLGSDRYVWTVEEVISPRKVKLTRPRTGQVVVSRRKGKFDSRDVWSPVGETRGSTFVQGDDGDYLAREF